MKVLLVEDEEMLSRIIVKRLHIENVLVDACYNGERALELLQISGYDLIIADVMMPLMDGITLIKEIRKTGNTIPILLLTAKDSVQDKVIGLNTGADDYLVKPFDFEELLARIYALTRRAKQGGSNTIIIDNLEIEPRSRTVFYQNNPITLTAKEFDLLYYLVSNQNIVLSRQQILDHVWEYDYESYSNLIDVYIKDLRKKIDLDPNKKFIQTIRGVGYVFKTED